MIQILPFLYLGRSNDVDNVETLRENNIRALVICCTYFEFPEHKIPDGFENLRIDIEDMGLEKISSYFEVSNNFIHPFISKEQSVLIFCCYGISRSSTILIAYLLEKQNFSFNDAFNFIMKKKKISPNIGFIEQLCEYEKNLKNEVTFSSKKYINWYTSEMCSNNVTTDFSF